MIALSALPAPTHNPTRRKTTYEAFVDPVRVVRRTGRADRIGDLGWVTGEYSDGLLRVVWDRDEIHGSVARLDAVRRLMRMK